MRHQRLGEGTLLHIGGGVATVEVVEYFLRHVLRFRRGEEHRLAEGVLWTYPEP